MEVEETYLKDYKDGTLVVTYEGSTEDIERVRDFVNHMYDAPDTCEDNSKQEEDLVNHPSHYASSGMECIDEMILLYGEEVVSHFCLCNQHKYRKRALDKGGRQDLDKSDWYIAKYKELKDIIEKRKEEKYNEFMRDMSSLLSNGATLDIENENFINLYRKYFS